MEVLNSRKCAVNKFSQFKSIDACTLWLIFSVNVDNMIGTKVLLIAKKLNGDYKTMNDNAMIQLILESDEAYCIKKLKM